MAQRLWFTAKRYGFGWTPATWQGWIITFVFAALVIVVVLTSPHRNSPKEYMLYTILPLLLLLGALVIICLRTGERPRWRWG
jgi:hypothetical protein